MSAHLCPRCSSACLCPRPTSKCEHNCARLEAMRSQLAAELRADVLAGRGRMPRDRAGRVDATFADAIRGIPKPSGSAAADHKKLERPQETPAERRQAADSLATLFHSITAAAAPAELPTSRVARLEYLERQLASLLEMSAPHLWRQMRAPLRRLLGRARCELRAADRADLTSA